MPSPTLVIVAGPNGSGKTTLISALRADPVFGKKLPAMYVNADDIQRDGGFDSATAQRTAAQLRQRALAERRDIMYETVMSHPSKLAELQAAANLGYEIHLFFVATGDPAINVDRVRQRVKSGGHDVPEDRTVHRYARTLNYAPVAVSISDHAYVFDNTHASRGIDEQAVLHEGTLRLVSDDPESWVVQLTTLVNARAENLVQLQAHVGELGCQLHSARLDSGTSDGVLEQVSAHYALQCDPRADACIAHDRNLLPRQVKEGEALRITYVEGVCELSSLKQRPAA